MKVDVERLKKMEDRSSIKYIWDHLFDYSHGNFIFAHGGKGTGKSFTLVQLQYIAKLFDTASFSNIIFRRRADENLDIRHKDAWEEDYPDDVEFSQSFAELLDEWSQEKKKDAYKDSLLVIDEFEIFVQYAMSRASKLTQIFLQQNRKLDMCVLGMVHDWGDLPNDILKWSKFLILKEPHLAKEWLNRYGPMDYDRSVFDSMTDAAEKKLAFIIPKVRRDKFMMDGELTNYSKFEISEVTLDDVAEVILVEKDGSPWNKPPEDTEEGDIIYESKSPANFDVGQVGGKNPKQWWPVFKQEIWPSLSTKLPYKCQEFFNKPSTYLETKDDISDYDAIEKVQQMIRENADMKDRYDNPKIEHDGKKVSFTPGFWAKATGKDRGNLHDVVK
ncbi:MAG: hypothetical protein V5A88_07355 [Candidatus Thermoplasmatota archaeon]